MADELNQNNEVSIIDDIDPKDLPPSPFADELSQAQEEPEAEPEESADLFSKDEEESDDEREDASVDDDVEFEDDDEYLDGLSEDGVAELDDAELNEIIDEIEQALEEAGLGDEDDDADDADDQPSVVPHQALHKERMKRKQVQEQLQQATEALQVYQAQVAHLQQQLAAVKKALKDANLDGVIDVEIDDPPSEEQVKQMIQQQQQQMEQALQNTVAQLKEELDDLASAYGIDSNDETLAELMLASTVAAVMLGEDPTDAVENTVNLVRKLIARQSHTERRSVRRVVRRKRSPARKSQEITPSVSDKIRKGDIDGVFDALAEQMFQ